MSDIVNLLSNAGIDVKDQFGQKLISFRQKSTAFGIVMLALKIVPTASIMLFLNVG